MFRGVPVFLLLVHAILVCLAVTRLLIEEIPAHHHQPRLLTRYRNPFHSAKTAQCRYQPSKTSLRCTYMCLSVENRKTQDRWSKEDEKLLNRVALTACRDVLFTDFYSSATVGFRTNFLSLADFKFDLSRTMI